MRAVRRIQAVDPVRGVRDFETFPRKLRDELWPARG